MKNSLQALVCLASNSWSCLQNHQKSVSSSLLASLFVLAPSLLPTLFLKKCPSSIHLSLYSFFPLCKPFPLYKTLFLFSVFLFVPCLSSLYSFPPSLTSLYHFPLFPKREYPLFITNHFIGLYPLSHMSPPESFTFSLSTN